MSLVPLPRQRFKRRSSLPSSFIVPKVFSMLPLSQQAVIGSTRLSRAMCACAVPSYHVIMTLCLSPLLYIYVNVNLPAFRCRVRVQKVTRKIANVEGALDGNRNYHGITDAVSE